MGLVPNPEAVGPGAMTIDRDPLGGWGRGRGGEGGKDAGVDGGEYRNNKNRVRGVF